MAGSWENCFPNSCAHSLESSRSEAIDGKGSCKDVGAALPCVSAPSPPACVRGWGGTPGELCPPRASSRLGLPSLPFSAGRDSGAEGGGRMASRPGQALGEHVPVLPRVSVVPGASFTLFQLPLQSRNRFGVGPGVFEPPHAIPQCPLFRYRGDQLGTALTCLFNHVSKCLSFNSLQGLPSPRLWNCHSAAPHPAAHLLQDRYGLGRRRCPAPPSEEGEGG